MMYNLQAQMKKYLYSKGFLFMDTILLTLYEILPNQEAVKTQSRIVLCVYPSTRNSTMNYILN